MLGSESSVEALEFRVWGVWAGVVGLKVWIWHTMCLNKRDGRSVGISKQPLGAVPIALKASCPSTYRRRFLPIRCAFQIMNF